MKPAPPCCRAGRSPARGNRSKKSSAVSSRFWPILSSTRPTRYPCRSFVLDASGSRCARALRRIRLDHYSDEAACRPFEMNVFEPLMTYSSPAPHRRRRPDRLQSEPQPVPSLRSRPRVRRWPCAARQCALCAFRAVVQHVVRNDAVHNVTEASDAVATHFLGHDCLVANVAADTAYSAGMSVHNRPTSPALLQSSRSTDAVTRQRASCGTISIWRSAGRRHGRDPARRRARRNDRHPWGSPRRR